MSVTLTPYPEYRDSGLPWLGEIPAHWGLLRTKYVFREVDERTTTGEETHFSMSQKYGLIESSRIDEWRLQSESYVGGKLCKRDDLILNRLKAHLGVFAHALADGVVSPDYTVLRAIRGGEVRFFENLFKTPIYIGELRRLTKGIVEGFWRLYTDDFYSIRVPVPPAAEQKVILGWIDRFDGMMRHLVRTKHRLIELLNEQKQAIIHRAVTRGLDPNVPMKSTDLNWLPEVPEHWEVKPLKRWVAINSRVLPETTDPEYVFQYLDIGAVGTGFLAEQPELMRFEDAPSRARRVLRQGDTVISTVRTYLKAVYFVADEQEDLVASTGFAVLTPVPGIVPEYLSFVIQSNIFVERVMANSVGIAYPAIAETRLGALHLALPPTKREQLSLVEYIKGETQDIDEAIRRAQQEIDLVREYRTRLISDIVTGKLDVRGVKLPEPEEAVEVSLDGLESVVVKDSPDTEKVLNADL